MLVLTRGQQEAIVINGNIRIKVIKVWGHRTRLGIVAPKGVRVNRAEVEARLMESNDALAATCSETPHQHQEVL
jgi:carbon storage regulator